MNRGETIVALKMETVCFYETLASIDESTQCQNPEEQQHHHPHRCENLKSQIVASFKVPSRNTPDSTKLVVRIVVLAEVRTDTSLCTLLLDWK
jgi:hypothetical protein